MLEIKNKKIAPLFLFGSALLWSLSGIFTKSVAWNGVCLATLRGVIALIVSGLLLRGHKIQLNRNKILAAICYFVQGVLFMCANKYTTAANATVLQNTSPLYILLFNAILAHRKPSKGECVTCACLFAGVILAFVGNLGGGGIVGNVFALVSALFYAGVFFFSKEEGANPLESLFLGNACYLLLLPVMLTDSTVLSTSLPDWGFLILFAALTGIGAWLCFAVGIKHTSALRANFITMSEPVMAPVWTFLFLREMISPMSVAGCVIVIATLLIYNISASKKEG
jgi:drug/metabolite transporter (DMT)-like permease